MLAGCSPREREKIANKRNNLYFCNLKSKNNAMCTVTVNVDEEMLREVNPNLSDKTAIRKWVQELIDLRIQQLEFEDTETMSIEDAREMTLAAVREEYARP
jgi:hypothetical protein